MSPEPQYRFKVPEGVVTGLGIGGVLVLIGFLSFELSADKPLDLGKVGLSGVVGLVAGALTNPQGGKQLALWWCLLVTTGLGTIASAWLAMADSTNYPAATPAIAAFAGAFFGLLVDGQKWSVGEAKASSGA